MIRLKPHYLASNYNEANRLMFIHKYLFIYIHKSSSSVGIETRYRLYGPEIDSRWGAIFSAPVHTGIWAHSASYAMGIGFFLG